MQLPYTCSECGHEFDASFLGRCPKCRTSVSDTTPASAPVESPAARQWVSTADFIPGHDIVESRGIVWAAVSTMGMKKLGFSRQEDRLDHAADGAIRELLDRARKLGANAVICVQLVANNAEGGATTMNSTGVLASGTAVTIVPTARRSLTDGGAPQYQSRMGFTITPGHVATSQMRQGAVARSPDSSAW